MLCLSTRLLDALWMRNQDAFNFAFSHHYPVDLTSGAGVLLAVFSLSVIRPGGRLIALNPKTLI